MLSLWHQRLNECRSLRYHRKPFSLSTTLKYITVLKTAEHDKRWVFSVFSFRVCAVWNAPRKENVPNGRFARSITPFFIRHICFQTLLLVPNTTHPMLIGSFPPLWIPNDRKSDRKTSINRPIKRCYGARKITTHHARSAREGRGKLKWMNEWMNA